MRGDLADRDLSVNTPRLGEGRDAKAHFRCIHGQDDTPFRRRTRAMTPRSDRHTRAMTPRSGRRSMYGSDKWRERRGHGRPVPLPQAPGERGVVLGNGAGPDWSKSRPSAALQQSGLAPPNPAFGPIAPDNEVLSGPQRPLFSPRGSNLPYPLSAKRRLPRRSARRRAFQDAPTPLTRRVDSHQLVGPHLTTAKRDARRPRGIEDVSVRIHHAPQSNGGRVFGALEFDCAVRMPSTCAASINGSSSPADLDHTSDEFKTIIQEHYRRHPHSAS